MSDLSPAPSPGKPIAIGPPRRNYPETSRALVAKSSSAGRRASGTGVQVALADFPTMVRVSAPILATLRAALDLAARPPLVHVMRRGPLPFGVNTVIRIAGGCPATLHRAALATGRDPVSLLGAARVYVREVLWATDADHYRTMGVARGARPKDIAEHLLWFARWVAIEWDRPELKEGFAGKILPAWNALKTPGSRRTYDRTAQRTLVAPPRAGDRKPARRLRLVIRNASDYPKRAGRLQAVATIAAMIAVMAITMVDWIVFHPPSEDTGGKSVTLTAPHVPKVPRAA